MAMTSLGPPAAWLPARGDPRRAEAALPAEHPVWDSAEFSLTASIEERIDRAARRFAFAAVWPVERRKFDRRRTDRDRGAVIEGQYDPGASADRHCSSRFLAGALAQSPHGAMLHGLRHREAAGAYRRSERLGIAARHAAETSDQKV
jgi:hypothetical protein